MITWLGEDDLHGAGAGPSFTMAMGGIKFEKGKAVEVKDKNFIARARKNPFFDVSGDETEAAPEEEEYSDDEIDGLTVAELRELADKHGIAHAGMNKAELRDALK
jgi:hypothetical protein